jgi:hypothetical protein
MRGAKAMIQGVFSYVAPEQQVPQPHGMICGWGLIGVMCLESMIWLQKTVEMVKMLRSESTIGRLLKGGIRKYIL